MNKEKQRLLIIDRIKQLKNDQNSLNNIDCINREEVIKQNEKLLSSIS